MVIRLWHCGFRRWWETRRCDHFGFENSKIIEMGRRKMFWCDRCERTWFS